MAFSPLSASPRARSQRYGSEWDLSPAHTPDFSASSPTAAAAPSDGHLLESLSQPFPKCLVELHHLLPPKLPSSPFCGSPQPLTGTRKSLSPNAIEHLGDSPLQSHCTRGDLSPHQATPSFPQSTGHHGARSQSGCSSAHLAPPRRSPTLMHPASPPGVKPLLHSACLWQQMSLQKPQ